jgi:hypothetical protein
MVGHLKGGVLPYSLNKQRQLLQPLVFLFLLLDVLFDRFFIAANR